MFSQHFPNISLQEIVKRLLKSSDVMVENFKAGTLEKYGLSFLARKMAAVCNKYVKHI